MSNSLSRLDSHFYFVLMKHNQTTMYILFSLLCPMASVEQQWMKSQSSLNRNPLVTIYLLFLAQTVNFAHCLPLHGNVVITCTM